jgi:ABC-type spermidine/putrescine transport system permease subunit II
VVRRPYVLAAVTWGYIAWSFLPVAVAIAISLGWDPLTREFAALNADAYRAALRGSELRGAFVQSVSLALGTVAVVVPMGTVLGLGLAQLDRRRWRVVGAALLAMIALPHVALGVVFFHLFIFAVRIQLNTLTQLIGHITIALPFVALIIWTRVLFLDASYEEQAADLGAPPLSTLTHVLLPLCTPAIVVAAAVAFAVSFNELPVSRYLCTPHDCQTIPMLVGGEEGSVSPPAVAIAVIATGLSVALLVLTLLVMRAVRNRWSG